MKTNEKTFDTVKFMRQQRDRLSEVLHGMTEEEIVEYFRKRKEEMTTKPQADFHEARGDTTFIQREWK